MAPHELPRPCDPGDMICPGLFGECICGSSAGNVAVAPAAKDKAAVCTIYEKNLRHKSSKVTPLPQLDSRLHCHTSPIFLPFYRFCVSCGILQAVGVLAVGLGVLLLLPHTVYGASPKRTPGSAQQVSAWSLAHGP